MGENWGARRDCLQDERDWLAKEELKMLYCGVLVWFDSYLENCLQIDLHCVMKAIRKLRRKTESKTSVPRVTR